MRKEIEGNWKNNSNFAAFKEKTGEGGKNIEGKRKNNQNSWLLRKEMG